MKTVRVVVGGRVQGVGYRAWCRGVAREIGLAGRVRNRRDGTVEAVLAGDEAMIDTMLARLRQGPPGSRVDSVDVAPADDDQTSGFEIRSTA
ncbi:acylphosphatase [Mangrovibrevibacter kandeliae]|uniref:acylphosphatase n=1 Tax=Mangrovibrevibacter kandeliae TaxID=2968473 RepID=UPI00211801F7|nr:acylphosphatase [Aurantimonas sp. CSK15Z-1]